MKRKLVINPELKINWHHDASLNKDCDAPVLRTMKSLLRILPICPLLYLLATISSMGLSDSERLPRFLSPRGSMASIGPRARSPDSSGSVRACSHSWIIYISEHLLSYICDWTSERKQIDIKKERWKEKKSERNCHLWTLVNDRLQGNGSADDEGVRLLSGLIVLFPVVPLSEEKINRNSFGKWRIIE